MRGFVIVLAAVLGLAGCGDDSRSLRQLEKEKTVIVESPGGRGVTSNKTPQSLKGTKRSDERPRQHKGLGANGVRTNGLVKDNNGLPVEGAAITLWAFTDDELTTLPWQRVASSRSDEKGRFVIYGKGGMETALTVRKDGFVTGVADDLKNPEKLVGTDTNTVEVQITPGEVISGRILFPDGTGASDVELYASPDSLAAVAIGEYRTVTDQSGHFTMNGLPHGKTALVAAAPDRPVQLFESVAPVMDLELKLSEKISRLDGKVFSADTDITSKSITILQELESPLRALRLNRKVDVKPDGKFDFGDVSSLACRLYVEADPAGSLVPVTDSYRSGRPYVGVDLLDGKSFTAVVEVTGGKTLNGVAVDVDTSSPISGVRIYTDSRSFTRKVNFTETDRDGVFTLPHIYRTGSVVVDSDAYHLVSPKSEDLIRHDTSETMTLLMKIKPVVRGLVVNKSRSSISGAKLSLYNLSPLSPIATPIALDPSGAFYVSLKAGKYRFFAEAAGYAPVYVDKDVLEEDINGLVLQLDIGRKVSGQVVSPEGTPVSGAVVLSQLCKMGNMGLFEPYYPYGNTTFQMPFGKIVTDQSGRFAFSQIPPDSGFGIIAKSDRYADSDIFFTAATEGDITDARIMFPETGILRGTIVDEDGKPVPGATCTASESGWASEQMSVETSTSGTFEFKKVDKTVQLSLGVSKSGFKDFNGRFQASDEPLSVTLRRNVEATLMIKCFNIADKQPVDATINVGGLGKSGPKPMVEKTDQVGLYTVKPVVIGEQYYVIAAADGFMSESVQIQPKQGVTECEIAMRLAGWVSGRVVDESGKPVIDAGIYSFVDSTGIRVDGEGRFKILIERNNTRYYARTKVGQKSEEFLAQSISGEVVDVGDIVVVGKKNVTIRAIRKADGKPLTGVTAEISDSGKNLTLKTDMRGEIHYTVGSIGNLKVTLPAYNVIRHYLPVDYAAGSNNIMVIPVGTGILQGKLFYNGKPVAGSISGSYVSASVGLASLTTDSSGEFRFEGLTPGDWTITGSIFDKQLFRTQKVQVSIKDDETVEQDIEISDSLKIIGSVENEDGIPVPRATVGYEKDDGSSSGDSTDASGNFSITAMGAGEYTVTAQYRGQRSDQVNVSIDKNSVGPIKLVLKSGTGRVVCEVLSISDGLPIRSAYASLKAENYNATASAQAEGNSSEIVCDNLSAGQYQLTVSAYGYSQVTRTIDVKDGETQRFTDVLSPAASVNVNVVDMTGLPVKGAQVTISPVDTSGVFGSSTASTGNKGAVSFSGVYAGRYNVHAVAGGGSAQAMVSTANRADVSVVLKVDGEVNR